MERATTTESSTGPRKAARLRAVLAGVVLASCLAACDHATSADELSDPRVPIRARSGQQFAIRLESNASTGYSWRLARPLDEGVVGLTSSRYLHGDSTRVGAPGSEAWTFRAVAAGRAAISLEYVQPWLSPAPPAQTADFTVIVE